MSHDASTADNAARPARLATHDIEVPPVHMQEPVLEPGTWMDELDGNTASIGRSAAPTSALPPSPSRTPASLPLKPILSACLVGLAILGYLQYGSRLDKIQDLLGTNLPMVTSTGPTDPDLITPAVDPRLGDAEARVADPASEQADAGLQQPGETQSQAVDVPAEPVDTALTSALPPLQSMAPSASVEHVIPMPTRMAEPTGIRRAANAGADEGLDTRMQQLEQRVWQLSQQLEQVQARQAVAVPPSVTQRPAQVRRVAKAQPAAEVDALPNAAVQGPQLISVDMWNGEPSVVVTSGQPGDKRMRVLRPGDVVNGMVLRSADPVSRTATFMAPGSQGLTLSVNQGG